MLRHQVGLGQQDLDLPADVGGVPRRPLRPELGDDPVRRPVPVDPAHLDRFEHGWGGRVAVAQGAQLVVPTRHQLRAVGGDDLVRPRIGPRPPIPHLTQPRPRLLTQVLAPPLSLVPVDVAVDLTGASAERPDIRRELVDLPSLGVQGEAACREDRPELRVGCDRGVPDPVDRLDHVAHAHRVQAPPGAGGEHAGVDLQVQMPMGVPGAGGVMPDHGCLDLLDRYLHLATARSYPGGCVLGDPADDLAGGLVLGFVKRGRDVWMKRGGQ